MKKKRILVGIPPHSHVALSMDEVAAMRDRGLECFTADYGRNDQSGSIFQKLRVTLKNAWTLHQKIKTLRPDAVYLNSRLEPIGSVRDFITLALLHTLHSRLPKVIIKSHGSNLSIFTGSVFYRKVVIPYLSRKVGAWIFLSHEEKNWISSHNKQMATKVFVVPNIIVPERCVASSEFLKKYPLPREKFICLFAGRLVPEKGVFDILSSITELQHPERYHFVFVGDGESADELRKRAATLPVGASVQFTGFLPDTECDQFYGVADVLVYPTVDSEGFAMALFKSVACGVPVITTAVRAAMDHLREPENVLWVQPHSPKAIAVALERIFADDILRNNMQVANKLLARRFAAEEIAGQIEHVFQLAPSPAIELA